MMLASIILAASLLENAQAITNYSAQIDAAIVAKGGTTRGGLTNAVAGINSIPSVAKVFFECDVIPLVTTVNDTSSTFYHAFIGETCKIPVEYGTTIRLYNSLPAQWLILHEYDANGNYVDHWRHYPDKMVYPNCYRDITITHANTAYIQSDVAYIGNNVSTFYIQNLNTGEVLFSSGKSHQSKGLCFTAETAGSTVRMVTSGSAPSISIETSRTGFAPWTPFTVNSTTIALTNAGDKVFFRAGNDTGNSAISSASGQNKFVMTGSIKASGNINSLLKRDPSTISDLNEYCYDSMFSGCTSLTTAPELPVTNLADCCYSCMFHSCTSLTTVPELPATNLAKECYRFMFSGCKGITNAPALPSTTLTYNCYGYMFSGCTSLTTVPELPATNLANYCYQFMFSGCKGITNAPALPATTLSVGCYRYMFEDCISLKSAPILPATNLFSDCYHFMFNGCNSITDVYTKQNSFTACHEWLPDKSGATFHCSPSLTIPSPRSRDNVPPDWDIDKTYE